MKGLLISQLLADDFKYAICDFDYQRWFVNRTVGQQQKESNHPGVYAVVQFYPWLKFYFPLFQTHYPTLQYPKTKEHKIWTKDKIEPQQIHNSLVESRTRNKKLTSLVGNLVLTTGLKT